MIRLRVGIGASTVACIDARDGTMILIEALSSPERRRRWSAERHSRAHCRDGAQGLGIRDRQGARGTMIPLPSTSGSCACAGWRRRAVGEGVKLSESRMREIWMSGSMSGFLRHRVGETRRPTTVRGHAFPGWFGLT